MNNSVELRELNKEIAGALSCTSKPLYNCVARPASKNFMFIALCF